MSGENAPDPEFSPEVTISVGPDGRVYFHDLDPELIEVALAVNPADEGMRQRWIMSRTPGAAKQEESTQCRNVTH